MPLLLKVTVPVGVGVPLAPFTAAVRVTEVPAIDVFPVDEEERTTLGVFWVTTCEKGSDVLVA
jgi:hypothetical protein